MKAAVIGAGIGGLCAAIRLAAAGADVTVFEAGPAPGGKAGTITLDGVEVDTGPSVLTMPDVFDRVLQLAGRGLHDVVQVRVPSPASRALDPDAGVVDIHTGVEPTLDSVRDALGGHAAGELRDFLTYARRIWDASAPWFVLGPAPTPGRLPRLVPAAIRHLPAIDPLRTMDAALDARVRHPALRRILRRYATYNGSDPRRAPATLHCIAWVEIGLGVYAIDGGIAALVRALADAAVSLGVDLRLDTPVDRVLLRGRQAVGVRTADGVDHAADAVLSNADAAHLVRDLLPPRPRSGVHAGPPSMSGWTAILRTRAPADLAGHTVLFPQDYTAEFADIFDRDRPPRDPTVYLCAQSRAHARPRWADGTEALFVMANAPAEPPDSPRPPRAWSDLEDRVRARLRAAGLAQPGDPFLWVRTPRGLATRFRGTRGAIYGASSNDPLSAFRRPPNRAPRIRGLYLASGSAHPGGGMPLCALSGLRAAEEALEDA